MDFQVSVGINIEKNRLSLVCLKRSIKGIFLAGQAIYSLEKEEPEDKAMEIGRFVNEFLNANRVLSADIFLGIDRDSVILRYVELPLAVKENLKGTLLYEMEKYVPLPVTDIYFDFQVISEDKAAGRLTVLLVAVKKEIVDPYINGEHRFGSGVSGIEINSTALVNFFSRKSGVPKTDTYAVVSLQGQRLELGLVEKSLLRYSRHVRIDKEGGNLPALVNEELALLGKTLGGERERLEMVLCGSNDSVEELLGKREDIHLVPLQFAGTELASDLLAPAYGLALKGIRKTPLDINLLPVDLRKKVSKVPYYTMFALVGLLILAIIGWGGNNVMHQRHVSGQLESELRRLGAEVEAVNQTREKLKELEHQIDALNELRQSHVPVLNILREMSAKMPSTAWFNRLYITDEKGDVEGYADSASALIPLLAESPLLKDAAFLSPITKDKDGKERFRIGFTLR